jgi:L-rhamnose isomerase
LLISIFLYRGLIYRDQTFTVHGQSRDTVIKYLLSVINRKIVSNLITIVNTVGAFFFGVGGEAYTVFGNDTMYYYYANIWSFMCI